MMLKAQVMIYVDVYLLYYLQLQFMFCTVAITKLHVACIREIVYLYTKEKSCIEYKLLHIIWCGETKHR